MDENLTRIVSSEDFGAFNPEATILLHPTKVPSNSTTFEEDYSLLPSAKTRVYSDKNSTPKEPTLLSPGTLLLGEYEIITVLGRGGFGAIYSAYDNNLDREIAVKEFLPAHYCEREYGDLTVNFANPEYFNIEQLRKQFRNEGVTLAQLSHPSLVQIYHQFEANNTTYLVLEKLNGHTLDELKADNISFEKISTIANQVASSLIYIHNQGLVHGDISPKNIVQTKNDQIKLLDFGIAAERTKPFNNDDEIIPLVVKDGYSPIEAYTTGVLEPARDIYSYGATLYRLITGKAPVSAIERVPKDNSIYDDPHIPLMSNIQIGSKFPKTFLKAIDDCLAIKPSNRLQSLEEFIIAANLGTQKLHSSSSQNQTGIFISYRRNDVSHAVTRLYDWLTQKYDRDKVFIDIDDIPIGSNFVKYISQSIASSAVMLVIIGPCWMKQSYFQKVQAIFGRVADPDFVRIELELAKQYHVPIIPILVDGAKIPSESELAKSIKYIAYLNGVEWDKPNDLTSMFPTLTALIDANLP